VKRMHPSPALVISLIALFVALGGTTYAAVNALPRNSVGTKQLKNGAVTAAKLNASALAHYLKSGRPLPPGTTETGAWAAAGSASGGSDGLILTSFPVPLAAGLDVSHTIYVTSGSATHCSGPGHAAAGYLCVYQANILNAHTPDSSLIFDPTASEGAEGSGANGWAIYVSSINTSQPWTVGGTYAVTAP